ncbi:6-phosphofructokinase [Solitalea koreensis]|uniref:ATP-dependent 6-phosphofructokinase n=1 Tax=Solitalea koreensis TaxID=543615 RepID=A0A521CLM5_9SPHI|nr:6-phosphofructokinase [Solitalea koreensis]SMO60265.1 6-phosphofructokinase [Solitalea koreensis]
MIKKIGVFTSGGDAPGMNACIRAVVRTAIYHNIEVVGIMRGYEGMINGEFIHLETESVANIIQRGGTILKTARSKDFMTPEGRKKAYDQLKANGIDAIVAIGGNGTFTGAAVFEKEYGIPAIGIPGTIDNDLLGTDFTIGFDTAINTVVDAVDAIRDTAESHDRLFLVEVMGRDSGQIAMASGIGSGAEAILMPEVKGDAEELFERLAKGTRKKSSKIVIVAEGDEAGGAFGLAERVKERFPNYDTRVSVLGHIQRGGSPTCHDRMLASQLGFTAVEALLQGKKGAMVGIINQEVVYTPFSEAIKDTSSKLNPNVLRMIEILSS